MGGLESLAYIAPHPSILASSIVFATIIFLVLIKRKSGSSTRDPSLPPQCKASLKQHTEGLFSLRGPEFLLEQARQMGCTDYQIPTISLPGVPKIFNLTDHRSARKALEDVNSKKVHIIDKFFERTTHNGPNVITAEGHRWKHVKKSTAAAFNAANLKKMIDPIDGILDKWVESALEPSMKSQTPIDILGEMYKITANIIMDVTFDYTFEKGEREAFLHDLLVCWTEFGIEGRKNMFASLPILDLLSPSMWRGRRAAKQMYDFCGKMLRAYREKKSAGNRKEHKLIDMIESDDEYADDGERCRDMIAYVIAGFETTANTLSFALRALAMDQDEQTKLRDELWSQASPNDARNCKQLKMVIKETLRMYPAVATGSVRRLGSDLVLPWSKKVIPKDSWIVAQYYCIQRDPAMYDDPNTFRPSRWENPTNEQSRALMTFSVGRRSCQGQGLANLEMNEILYKLISKYRFDVVEAGEPQSIVLFKPVGTLLSAYPAE